MEYSTQHVHEKKKSGAAGPVHPVRNARTLLGRALVVAILAVPATACDDPLPTDTHDDEDPTADLSVDLTVSPDHVHTLSETSFTVHVTDHHGEAITDFTAIEVQRKEVGETEWHGTELSLSGDDYVGTYTFTTSGEYDIRVAGQRPDDADLVVMYEMPEPLPASRAHHETGGYRVAFENFPGHLHDGDTGTLRFWVTETEEDSSGERPPITGLTPEIHVTESGGSETHHTATGTSDGVYEADHTFGAAGSTTIGLHFTGSSGAAAEAEFTLEVSHVHN